MNQLYYYKKITYIKNIVKTSRANSSSSSSDFLRPFSKWSKEDQEELFVDLPNGK